MSDTQDIPVTDDGRVRQGDAPPMETASQKRAVVELAFDYRGDVTVHTSDGREIEGYLYDRTPDGPKPSVKLLQGNQRMTVRWDEVTKIAFTGRDTAAGKSWETWVKKYAEKKAKGEAANIEAEKLD